MKVIQTSGKRKTATARLSMNKGSGQVTINGAPMEMYTPTLARMKIQEPLILVGKVAEKYDITISVNGGGVNSQAEAMRLAISRALAEAEGEKIKNIFTQYDRQLLVADVRRREMRKPNTRGRARAKRQKSYR